MPKCLDLTDTCSFAQIASAEPNWGDLLLSFSPLNPSSGRRTSPWRAVACSSEWTLSSQSADQQWRGFPVRTLAEQQLQAWFVGEFSVEGQKESLQELVLKLLQNESAATGLNGHTLLLAWETAKRRWHLWTNRFGTLHAYYGSSNGRAALGTSFQSVANLASQRKLDWTALAGFFSCGFFPADRTFYDDVRILQPATHYIFSQTGDLLQSNRYWRWEHRPEARRSYDDTVAEFGSLFEQVMAEQLREGRIALPISGGLDSRCTVAAVKGQGADRDLWAYSYGYTNESVETRIAGQVASTRGLPFQRFTIQPYLFERLEDILGAVEGFQDVTQCRQAFITRDLQQNADYVIAAHWGDVWLDDMGLAAVGGKSEIRSPKSEAVLEHLLAKMLKKGHNWLLDNLCAQHLGRTKPEPLVRQFVADGLKPLEHILDPDFRVIAF
jgi:hypothetical protein